MAFSRTELGVLRRTFNRSFVAGKHPLNFDKSIEFDEAMAARMCVRTIVRDMFYARDNNEQDIRWLEQRLDLDNPAVVLMDMVEMHQYVLSRLDELILEQS